MKRSELKIFLDEKYNEYNRPGFIPDDPVSIPHSFSLKQDIEIAAFLSSLIAWGRRDIIIRSAKNMMERMEQQPYEYLLNTGPRQWKSHLDFVHRTFNGMDLIGMFGLLKHLYQNEKGLEGVFEEAMVPEDANAYSGISALRMKALSMKNFPERSRKHLPNPEAGASAKRMNMFLRWMVRDDGRGVDFGLWKGIDSPKLICPLDIHTGRVARALNILKRKQDDRQAAEELTDYLRKLDPKDPAKYDFALFGLGVNDWK